MKIDEKALEGIVREVVERLLAQRPELIPAPPMPAGDLVLEHFGRLLSEEVLLTCRKQGKRAVRVDQGVIVTPLARDRARDLGVRILVREQAR